MYTIKATLKMEIKSYELVIARYNECIKWLFNVSKKWKITVYNKGPAISNIGTIKLRYPNITIIELENKGREAETFAYHMLHCYDNYADLTIFSQADPFDHAPEMIQLLEILVNKTTLDPETEKFFPMTICYNNQSPPKHITDSRINRFYTVHDMNVYTLDFTTYDDRKGAQWIIKNWNYYYNGKNGDNIAKSFFNLLEQPQLLKGDELTIKFLYGACFALPKYSLMQYSKSFYETLYSKTYDTHIAPWLLERFWLHIFDQNFDSTKILPEYTRHT